ncbi:MAG: sensor histidine kinase [Chloroflexota bacterium]
MSTHLWNRRATVMVRDAGIGIAPQETERIFEKFYRTNDGARFAHGTGLGLSIARSIVALHGGRLTAESDGRSGTTMTVELSTDVPPAH